MPESAPAASSTGRCLRCGSPAACHAATVPLPSIFQKDDPCPHGPFCARCATRKEALTLPQCECRSLISGWSPPLPLLPLPEQRSVALGRALPSPVHTASPPVAPVRVRPPGVSLPEDDDARAGPTDGASWSEAGVEDVIRRALAAVDSLISKAPEPETCAPCGEVVATERANESESFHCRNSAGLGASHGSSGATSPASDAESSSSAAPSGAAGRSLAEALQLRGGRPRRAKAAPGSGPALFGSRFAAWNQLCSTVQGALGCNGATEATDSKEVCTKQVEAARGGG